MGGSFVLYPLILVVIAKAKRRWLSKAGASRPYNRRLPKQATTMGAGSMENGIHRSAAMRGSLRGSRDAPFIITLEPNDTIYAPGQIRRATYRVEYGAVRIYRLLASGRRHICSFEYSGDVFGFEGGIKHTFFAEAINQTHLSALSTIGETIQDDAGPWLQSMERTQRNLLVLGYRDPVERVAAFLCDLEARQGSNGTIVLSMPRADIADHLCLSIETISRVFTYLRVKGLIKLRNPRTVDIVGSRALHFLIG